MQCLVAFALALLTAGAAHASVYCVGSTGCDQDFGTNLQGALDQAKANGGEDTVRIADGFYFSPSGYMYDWPDPVHIEGAGGRFEGLGAASLAVAGTPSNATTLTVLGSTASTISGLDVRVPDGSSNKGIETNGSIDNVLVQDSFASATSPLGVLLHLGGRLTNSTVDAGLVENFSVAVSLAGSATVSDSDLAGQFSLRANTSGTVARVSRTHMKFTQGGAFAGNGVTMGVDDSLLEGVSVGGTTALAAEVDADGAESTLTLNHVTIAGSSRPGSAALAARAATASHSRLIFRNGVIADFTDAFFRDSNAGSLADISTDWSNYGGGRATDFGPGTITETNHTAVPPGFLSATDYHLRADSPLVDAGDPAGLAADEPPTDLSTQPRIADGNGDCDARRDIGAYEFTPGPRAPRAVASTPFDASASCDPDGDPLTFAWTFDDGATAVGASVQHTFATPGLHFGTVTVTDSTGRSATATTSVTVPKPPPLFTGVTIAKQKVRASKEGVVKVKLRCPPSATGSCRGTLTLLGKGAGFRIAPRRTASVAIKLPGRKLKLLRRRGTLRATARASARDASGGAAKRSSGKITLLRPR